MSPRSAEITKITPHHVAGNATIEAIGQVFATPNRNASSNYGIGSDGRGGMYVEEKNRSWCSSSSANDNVAVTIEVANNSGDPLWTVSGAAWESLIALCVDICRRNPGIKQKDGKPGIYCDDTPNASLTFHRYFALTGCAQPFMWDRRQQLCAEVNKRLNAADEKEENEMPGAYEKLGDVPIWHRPTIQKLMEKGVLTGVSDPNPDSLEDNILNVDETYCRVMTTLDRLGKLD